MKICGVKSHQKWFFGWTASPFYMTQWVLSLRWLINAGGPVNPPEGWREQCHQKLLPSTVRKAGSPWVSIVFWTWLLFWLQMYARTPRAPSFPKMSLKWLRTCLVGTAKTCWHPVVLLWPLDSFSETLKSSSKLCQPWPQCGPPSVPTHSAFWAVPLPAAHRSLLPPPEDLGIRALLSSRLPPPLTPDYKIVKHCKGVFIVPINSDELSLLKDLTLWATSLSV